MMCVLMQCLLAVIFLLTVQLHSSLSTPIPCTHREEVCDCTTVTGACDLTLVLQRLRTFTSYPLDSDGYPDISDPGTAYTLSNDGYVPTSAGSCRITADNFLAHGCSLPMTVDGDYNHHRMFTAVNGCIPGPTIIANKGQLVRVDLVNLLDDPDDRNHNPTSTSMHWHGMHQVRTPWMDGVEDITQVPIRSGRSFDYIFKATPAGTHWYHSHSGIQRTEGAFGSLIVRETDGLPDISSANSELSNIQDMPSEHTLTLLDWYRIGSRPVEYNNAVYHSGLINGKGRLNNAITPISIFDVRRNMNYRFRVIGAQNHFAYKLSIEGHQLYVIATDGNGNGSTLIRPQAVDFLIVHSGERYDFIPRITGTAQQDDYWIVAQMVGIDDQNNRQWTNLTNPAVALLRYDPSSEFDWRSLPISDPPVPTCNDPCTIFNCLTNRIPEIENQMCVPWSDLTSLFPSPDDILPNISAFMIMNNPPPVFNFAFEGLGKDPGVRNKASIDAKSFKMPTAPYLCNGGTAHDCASNKNMQQRCVHIHPIAPEPADGQVMVFTAMRSQNTAHPVHLHGHGFYVLEVGYDATKIFRCSSSSDEVCNPSYNSTGHWEHLERFTTDGRINKTFIQKDTILVPGGGYAVIAFKANNPGYTGSCTVT